MLIKETDAVCEPVGLRIGIRINQGKIFYTGEMFESDIAFGGDCAVAGYYNVDVIELVFSGS
jgi:hypothetical protein